MAGFRTSPFLFRSAETPLDLTGCVGLPSLRVAAGGGEPVPLTTVDASRGADLLIHDGEYTEAEYTKLTEWGHSAYTDALELAFQAGVKRLGLFHINQERTDEQMDKIVDDCRQIIADEGQTVECFAVGRDMQFTL